MYRLLTMAACLLFGGIAVRSQTVPTTLAELQTRLIGKRFLVKDLPAQTVTAYHLAAGQIQPDISPTFRSIALFLPKQVIIEGSTITVSGERRDLAVDSGTKKLGASPKGLKITLRIDLGGSVSISTMSNYLDQLFSTDATAALADIPDYFQSKVPAKAGDATPCKTCPFWIRQGSWIQKQIGDPSFEQIKVIRGGAPRMTPEAHGVGGNASVTFALVVDESGHPTELWLTKAAGYGLDEAAADAIRKSLYRPATYNGAPVAATITEETSFQTY